MTLPRPTPPDTPEHSTAPRREAPRQPPPPVSVVDGALSDRIRAGDHRAFEQLFRTYYPRLCSFAAGYLRADAIAEELVQDVLRHIWEHRVHWELRTTLEGYLYRAVRNRALRHLKHERVERSWAKQYARRHEAETDRPHAPAADASLQAAELAAAIQHAIAALPPRCREIFLLKWAHELSNRDVAELLGLSIKTVEMQVTRSFRFMREHLRSVLP